MYDDGALDAAHALIRDWTVPEIEQLRTDVPKQALKARFRQRTVQEIALEVLDYAREGLNNRAKLNAAGEDESIFLNTLFAIARSGVTPAEEALALFDGAWQGDARRAFLDLHY